jgi:hypothetical protein
LKGNFLVIADQMPPKTAGKGKKNAAAAAAEDGAPKKGRYLERLPLSTPGPTASTTSS